MFCARRTRESESPPITESRSTSSPRATALPLDGPSSGLSTDSTPDRLDRDGLFPLRPPKATEARLGRFGRFGRFGRDVDRPPCGESRPPSAAPSDRKSSANLLHKCCIRPSRFCGRFFPRPRATRETPHYAPPRPLPDSGRLRRPVRRACPSGRIRPLRNPAEMATKRILPQTSRPSVADRHGATPVRRNWGWRSHLLVFCAMTPQNQKQTSCEFIAFAPHGGFW